MTDSAPPTDSSTPSRPNSVVTLRCERNAKLRLYVARSTPNSVRAEHNLASALDRMPEREPSFTLEIIDVFAQPKRAITDGVVVTPTLIGSAFGRRVVLMGDLSDQAQLYRILQDLSAPPAA